SFIGNLLWFVFGGGLFACLGWFFVGIIFAVTIIGIPFAKAAFRIAAFAAFPFGRELIDGRLIGKDRIPGTGFINFLWCILAGLWLAIGHALAGLACCITIIGIPFGLAHFKLAQVSFAPLGKVAVSCDIAKAARAKDASAKVEQAFSKKGKGKEVQ
ncbi:MAG: YccF domain-containing protein, partial [bacterium]